MRVSIPRTDPATVFATRSQLISTTVAGGWNAFVVNTFSTTTTSLGWPLMTVVGTGVGIYHFVPFAPGNYIITYYGKTGTAAGGSMTLSCDTGSTLLTTGATNLANPFSELASDGSNFSYTGYMAFTSGVRTDGAPSHALLTVGTASSTASLNLTYQITAMSHDTSNIVPSIQIPSVTDTKLTTLERKLLAMNEKLQLLCDNADEDVSTSSSSSCSTNTPCNSKVLNEGLYINILPGSKSGSRK